MAKLVDDIRPVPLMRATYRISCINEVAQIANEVRFGILTTGEIRPESSDVEDIHVIIALSDLAMLVRGSVSYSALYLNGRIRERRYVPIDGPRSCVLEQSWERPPDHCEEAFLSGIFLLNCILSDGVSATLRQLDTEIDSLRASGYPVIKAGNIAKAGAAAAIRMGSSELTSDILDIVEHHLASLGKAPLNRVVNRDGGYFLGSLLDPNWDVGANAPERGVLLPHNLLEAQPHLGGGVRFPERLFNRMIANIIGSGILQWTALYELPPDVSLSEWRASSLFPVSFERLQNALASSGWTGRIELQGQADCAPSSRWWLGLPELENVVATNEGTLFLRNLG